MNIIYIHFCLLLLPKSVSVNTADDRGSFDFSTKVEFTSRLHVRITLATNTGTAALCFLQLLLYSQNILKLLAFKYFLSDLYLETEYPKVMLIWWFVLIKCIKDLFQNFLFWYLFPDDSLLLSTFHRPYCPFSIYRHYDHKLELSKFKLQCFILNFNEQLFLQVFAKNIC